MLRRLSLRRSTYVPASRFLHDTPEPKILKVSKGGRGGRSTVSGKRVVLFGAGGFLGRYVSNELGKQGHICILPNRGDELEYRFLKPMFDLGQVAMPYYHARDEDSIRRAIIGADCVISLIGKQYETKHLVQARVDENGKRTRVNFSFEDVNDRIPANIARIAKEEGVERFIHVSALNQDLESESRWAKAKATGEISVRKEFPEAIIVRPAVMFGVEDTFLNYFSGTAYYPFTPIVHGGGALVQPVYVGDVARAIVTCMNKRRTPGKTYELAGADEYTVRECAEFVYDVTGLKNNLLDLPMPVAKLFGDICTSIPSFARPMFSREHAIMMGTGSTKDRKSPFPGLDALDVETSAMERVAWTYLHRHRSGGHFSLASGYHKDVQTE